MAENKVRRDASMDALRVLACFMVIATHVVTQSKIRVSVGSSRWNLMLFWNCAVHFILPVFFMLAGAFSKSTDKRQAIGKSIFYFIAFVLSSVFYYFSDAVLSGEKISFWGVVYGIISYKYHLWFLLNMVVVTLLSPLMNRIEENDLPYACALMAIFTVGFKSISYFCANIEPVALLSGLISELVPSSFMFCGYFLLGKLLYIKKEDLKSKRTAAALVLTITTVVAFFVNKRICDGSGLIDERFFSNDSIFLYIQCICLFILFLNINVPVKLEKINAAVVPKIFGIYIIHILVIDIITHFGITPAGIGGIFPTSFWTTFLLIPLETVIVYALSWLLSFPLYKVEKLLRRFCRMLVS